MQNLYLIPIRGYQYISKLLPANCRYYPTCSEYASWQFEFNQPHRALYHTTLRILRCNQLFSGGIDYPVIHYTPPRQLLLVNFNTICGKIDVLYWLVPKDESKHYYYLVKDFDAINSQNNRTT